jgi:hypothetical protein
MKLASHMRLFLILSHLISSVFLIILIICSFKLDNYINLLSDKFKLSLFTVFSSHLKQHFYIYIIYVCILLYSWCNYLALKQCQRKFLNPIIFYLELHTYIWHYIYCYITEHLSNYPNILAFDLSVPFYTSSAWHALVSAIIARVSYNNSILVFVSFLLKFNIKY